MPTTKIKIRFCNTLYKNIKHFFQKKILFPGVSSNAPIGKSVTKLSATDPDTGTSQGLQYTLSDIKLADNDQSVDAFQLYQNDTVMTNRLMGIYESKYFKMNVAASDSRFKSLANLRVRISFESAIVSFS